MKTRINISIKRRIYWSFFLLVCLFVFSAVITHITLNKNEKLSDKFSLVVYPSLQAMDDLKKMMLESEIYVTNWVFLKSKHHNKKLLQNLHDTAYYALKAKINSYSSRWMNKNWVDSINKVLRGFEEVMVIESTIITSLSRFGDYDDPVIRLEAERAVEEDILPRIAALMNAMQVVHTRGLSARSEKNAKLERSSRELKGFLFVLALATICAGFFLSMYLTKLIIGPVNRISLIINDLGKGIIGKINHKTNGNEIGKMIRSVNNLSEKLHATTMFAHEIGLRNFDAPFKALSEEDTLGKALIAMRGNLKASEEELIEANAEIQTIYNASLDAVIIIDKEGKIVKWDSRAEGIFGWKEEEIMGKTLTETIIPVRYREAHERGMKHFFNSGKGPILGKTVEVHGLKKNNEEIDISLCVSPSFIKDKHRFIGFIRDITSRKKAEAELHDSEERYRQIVETASEGIWMIDKNNRTSFVNKQLCEILGYSAEEMIGKELFDFMDEEGKKIALIAIEQRNEGASEAFDFKFITKEGKTIWTHLSNSPFLDDKGAYKGAMAMVTDISQRKLDEELLKQSEINLAVKNKELEQKNKQLEQFAFVASHDLQVPLRTTASFVELLQQQYKGRLDQKADKYLDYILQASDRMTILITDLLEYSRIGDKQELKKVDCNSTMSEVLTDLDIAINNSGAEIEMELLPVIHGYEPHIKQLFQNLTYNAIKFRQKNIPPKLNISVSKRRDTWEFAFADNGIGIAKEHYEKIFIIFQRLHTRSKYKGSGIGLSFCKKIVELHEGKIWLESEIGKGTTFYFTIPQKNTL